MVMVYLSERMQVEREEVCGATSKRVPCVELQWFSPGKSWMPPSPNNTRGVSPTRDTPRSLGVRACGEAGGVGGLGHVTVVGF